MNSLFHPAVANPRLPFAEPSVFNLTHQCSSLSQPAEVVVRGMRVAPWSGHENLGDMNPCIPLFPCQPATDTTSYRPRKIRAHTGWSLQIFLQPWNSIIREKIGHMAWDDLLPNGPHSRTVPQSMKNWFVCVSPQPVQVDELPRQRHCQPQKRSNPLRSLPFPDRLPNIFLRFDKKMTLRNHKPISPRTTHWQTIAKWNGLWGLAGPVGELL